VKEKMSSIKVLTRDVDKTIKDDFDNELADVGS